MKMNLSYGSCKLFVQGIDMSCPMCGTVVLSGQTHQCSVEEKEAPRPKQKRISKKPVVRLESEGSKK